MGRDRASIEAYALLSMVPAACVVNSRFRSCTSLVPRQMIMVFGLGTRLHVRMCTTLENGILRNGEQLQSVVNGFYRPG